MLKAQSPWRKILPSGAFYVLLAAATLHAADPRPRFLAFASENWLTIAIGQFVPGKGWLDTNASFEAPPLGAVFTLVGCTGKLGEVTGRDDHRADPAWTPIEWRMRVERGETMRQPFALAIQGSWPDPGSTTKELALDDPTVVRAVSKYLKGKGLNVEAPFLTQGYQADLDGDGQMETLVCAHSDSKAIRDDQPADVYAVALVLYGTGDREKIIKLASQTSHKPAHRSIAEQEKVYGTRDFYRIIAIYDIDGDGKPEVALYRAKDDATQIDIFAFKGRHRKKVLTAYKANYN